MTYKQWTCEEDAKLLASHRKGRSLADIARRHGRSHGAIKSRLRKHLFSKDYREKCCSEMTDDEIIQMWVDAGGTTFHGPITETVAMTEERIIKFVRSFL